MKDLKEAYKTIETDHFAPKMEISFIDGDKRSRIAADLALFRLRGRPGRPGEGGRLVSPPDCAARAGGEGSCGGGEVDSRRASGAGGPAPLV